MPFIFVVSPIIETINPAEGWTSGGATVIIVGDNFFEEIEVGFDGILVHTEVIKLRNNAGGVNL